MSHPFGEEKLWSHRVFVSFARELALRGHPVLRFDYSGTGDSSGELRDSSIESHIDDLQAAIVHLRSHVSATCRVGAIGLRLGASIVALAAERGPYRGIDGPLVLWDPVVNGDAYLQELLRSHLSTQLAVYGRVVEGRDALRDRIARGESVNLDGYDLAAPLFDSCARSDLLPVEALRFEGPALVMRISPPGADRLRADLESLATRYRRGSFASCTEDPFWKEIKPFYGRAANLQRETLAWLEAAHA